MCISKHCHILIGHGDNFKAYNPQVEIDSMTVLTAYKKSDEKTVALVVESAKKNRLFE
jgi:hypothetical protein